MPFASAKQEGWLWANEPSIAKKWTKEHGPFKAAANVGPDPVDRLLALLGRSGQVANKFGRVVPDRLMRLADEMEPQAPERMDMRHVFVNLPDVVQPDDFSCGAAVTQSVANYYGVGPTKIAEYKKILNTSKANSTSPLAITGYLETLGLGVKARSYMTIAELDQHTQQGHPVIVCIKDYMNQGAHGKEGYGHYMTVIGVTGHKLVIARILPRITSSGEMSPSRPLEG